MSPKNRTRIAREEWQKLHDWAAAQIKAGDMDFDDRVYRTRDATATLLELWNVDGVS